MKHTAILLPAVLALVACQTPAPTLPGPDACGASGYQSLVGRPLAAVTLPADVNTRVIEPDSAVTLDYKPERLNIRLNEEGRIVEVYCG